MISAALKRAMKVIDKNKNSKTKKKAVRKKYGKVDKSPAKKRTEKNYTPIGEFKPPSVTKVVKKKKTKKGTKKK